MSVKLAENIPEPQVPLVPGLACPCSRVCSRKILISHTAWMLRFSQINIHNQLCTVHLKNHLVRLMSSYGLSASWTEIWGLWSLSALPRDCSSGTWTEEHTRFLQSGAFITVPKIPATVSLNWHIQALPQTQRLTCWIRSTKWELELWVIAGFLN